MMMHMPTRARAGEGDGGAMTGGTMERARAPFERAVRHEVEDDAQCGDQRDVSIMPT